MIESGLQQEINFIMTQARNNRLEFVTVEHLLLALLNIEEVNTFLRNKRVNLDEIREELEEAQENIKTKKLYIPLCQDTCPLSNLSIQTKAGVGK